MLYAEKAMISRENQFSPLYRHNLKDEDIINRGGGGNVFIGEISTVNNDNKRHVLKDPVIACFSGIKESDEPLHLMVRDNCQ